MGSPTKNDRGGATPDQERMQFVCDLIQEMGGSLQDVRSPPHRKTKRGGKRGKNERNHKGPVS